jgi:hypothetical protein
MAIAPAVQALRNNVSHGVNDTKDAYSFIFVAPVHGTRPFGISTGQSVTPFAAQPALSIV